MTWQPLRGDDPVPGDPAEVSSYAGDLTRTADLIAEQVSMLRRLADPASWEADSADAFREQARDLATDIDRAEGRYRAVGSELSRWSGVLDDAQRQARGLRDEAQEQQRIVDSTPEPTPTAPPEGGPAELTPGQESQQRRRRQAEDEVDRLRGQLDRLVADTDQQAWEYGRRIRAALDDDVANGWFDRLKAKLSGISDVLRTVAKWAGYVALALGTVALVIALVVTAPVWLLTAAAVATAVAMVAGIGLALSENGSWWAPVLDFVSLVTFGVARNAKIAYTAAMKVARPVIGESRAAASIASSLARHPRRLALATRVATGRFIPGPLRPLGAGYLNIRNMKADLAGAAARRTVDVLPRAPFLQNMVHGGATPAGVRVQVRQFLAESDNPVVREHAGRALQELTRFRRAGWIADGSAFLGTFVKEPSSTTDFSRWKTLAGRLVKGLT